MTTCCGCYSAFRPRYKKLVDNIFPTDPREGLVRSNMDKLTFFSMKSPEKLDRIGEYLAQRLDRDIYRLRYPYVFIAMEALDILLVTCHAQSLNLFVESFLKMIQKLLETREPKMQVLATASFVKFANIEEDTPSYHRHYDFFVSHFSALSHTHELPSNEHITLRVSGLQGLHGVIRKTVTDDLQCNIWKAQHMDKIIPSLLFNMQAINSGNATTDPESPRDEENPSYIAETVFRDFVCRASYGNISAVIRPVLTHLDNHNLWVPNDFAVKCFQIIMYSVQAQYGYMVVQMLMSHLNENSTEYAKIKSSIVHVLSQTVLISAGGSIGPSVLEVFNTLLKHLKISVDIAVSKREQANEEKQFQEAIVNTIGGFANNLPDYQKIEIMMFVMSKVPSPNEQDKSSSDVMLQTMLLKSLLNVATKYKTVSIPNALPISFLEPLLRISTVHDPGIRRLVQEILHSLIDRHDNLPLLKTIDIKEDLEKSGIVHKKPLKPDILFIKKQGHNIYWHLHENIRFINNKVDNFESVCITMSLIYLEMASDDTLVDLAKLALEIQNSAMTTSMPVTHKCAMHAIVASFLALLSLASDSTNFTSYVFQVIKKREEDCPYYLPKVAFNRNNTSNSYPSDNDMKDSWLFSKEEISNCLKLSGLDINRFNASFISRPSSIVNPDLSGSLSDIHSTLDLETPSNSPVYGRKQYLEDITVESMKKALESNPEADQNEKLRQQKIYETFRDGHFEDIVTRSDVKNQSFLRNLGAILDSIGKESGEGDEFKMKYLKGNNALIHNETDAGGEDDDNEGDDGKEVEKESLFNNFPNKISSDISFPSLFVY